MRLRKGWRLRGRQPGPADAHAGAPPWLLIRVLGVVVAMTLVAGAIYSQRLASRIEQTLDRAENLRAALACVAVLRTHAADLEVGYRAYLLTGEAALLPPLSTLGNETPAELQTLRRLLRGYPGHALLVDAIEEDFARRRQQVLTALRSGAPRGARADTEPVPLRRDLQVLGRALNNGIGALHARTLRLVQRRSYAMLLSLGLAGASAFAALLFAARHVQALGERQRLQEAVVRSERASRDKSAWLAHASHEIRTPMNAIVGYGALLQARLQQPLERRYIDGIMRASRSLLTLLDDVLDLSKLEAGGVVLHPSATDLRELADAVLSMFQPQAARKGIVLRGVLAPALPAAVWIDGSRLRRILANLVGNAVKYTDSGEVLLRIQAAPEAEGAADVLRLVFEVADDGPGIPEAEQQSIFEPFVRASGAETGRAEGTGLGLSIARELAQLMGGEISLDSAVGRGSTFRLVLHGVRVTNVAAGRAR